MTRILQTGTALRQPGAKLTTVIPIRIKRRGGRDMQIATGRMEKNSVRRWAEKTLFA